MLGVFEIFGGGRAFGRMRPGACAICLFRGCLQATQVAIVDPPIVWEWEMKE